MVSQVEESGSQESEHYRWAEDNNPKRAADISNLQKNQKPVSIQKTRTSQKINRRTGDTGCQAGLQKVGVSEK